jgi:hypothetical protein
MQSKIEHLAPEVACPFLDALPNTIKKALFAYAEEMDYPVEAVLELAIAVFLDPDSVSFADCQPMSGAERDVTRIAS